MVFRFARRDLLSILAIVFALAMADRARCDEASPTRSTRKPVSQPVSSPVRAAVAYDPSNESIEQVTCKNCQANTGVFTPVEHVSTDSTDADVVVDDVVVDDGYDTYDSGGDSSCSIGGCRPWGITLSGGNGPCFDACSPLGLLSSRLYMRAEAASFWGSGQALPTLVTTTTTNPLPTVDQAGLIGNAGTQSLFGGHVVSSDASAGIRYEVGLWFDDCRSKGVLVRLFDSGNNDETLRTDGTQRSVIARNFLDVGPPRAQSLVSVAYPNQTSGSIYANLSSNVNGGDILMRHLLSQDCLGRVDCLFGYQTARLTESLDIVTNTMDQNAPRPTLDQEDHFRARSQFHGPTVGLSGEVRDGCWYFGGLFKVGLGNMERRVDISGSSRTTVGTDVATQSQGLLARQTNIGIYRQDTFVLVPELGLHAGYRLTGNLDFTIGYTMLRLPKVGRVVDTLDRELASNLSDPLTGEVRPSFTSRVTNYTLHSLNLGLQWAY